jgi:hypothetical protein
MHMPLSVRTLVLWCAVLWAGCGPLAAMPPTGDGSVDPGTVTDEPDAGAAPSTSGMVVQSLDGPVTPLEIASFKLFLKTQSPPQTNPPSNDLADGTSGKNVEALGLLFEVTHDAAFLDAMIAYAEAFFALRNDPNQGQVMWTGNRELVWITKPVGPQIGYAGCEQNDIIGHIAYAAKLILQSQKLWNINVPDGDPHGHGATYLARAKTFIQEAERTEDSYLVKWFIDPATYRIVAPQSPAWAAENENVFAYNRQMFFANGFQRLSECHQLLGDAPAKVLLYDQIVKTAVGAFVAGLQPRTSPKGTPVYNWGYGPGLAGSENLPIHGAYDIWGIWRAYASGRYGVTAATMERLANTLRDVIYLGNGEFSQTVDGSVGTAGPRRNIYPQWMLLAQADPEIYALTANANIKSGWQPQHLEFDAFILWIKNARQSGVFPKMSLPSN